MSASKVAEGYFQEVIKLQLKKPKNWNWQLSTSKSSPHIALPIIQLYDAKGHLLFEAKDQGGVRQSWRNIPNNNLQRCRSDVQSNNLTLDRTTGQRQQKKQQSRSRSHSKHRSSSPVVTIIRNGSVVKKGEADEGENVIKMGGEVSEKRSFNALRKSRSDLLDQNALAGFPRANSLRPIRSDVNCKSAGNGACDDGRRHRRSQSDDLFRRRKLHEASMRRAEIDGYRNFLIDINNNNDDSRCDKANFLAGDDEKSRKDSTHNRYTTRTSSAGTLIISEESFANNSRQRRRRRDASVERTADALDNVPVIRSRSRQHCRQRSSDPVDASRRARLQPVHETTVSPSPGLFYSLSDVFPFDYDNKSRCGRRQNKNYPVEDVDDVNNEINEDNDYPNYTVQEPPSSDSKRRKNSGVIIEKLEGKKRRRKLRKHYSDVSTSSDTRAEKKHRTKTKENRTKDRSNEPETNEDRHYSSARVVKEHLKDGVVGSGDLLRLVRRLSSVDHVKMGANVSRHSSKGLSGRRSQSSGSICNGKGGRHSDGKMCGSLPSYLDDRGSTTGCNNNHQDCEKPPLEEVQRIPPLGNGAPLHWKFSDNQTVFCDQGYGSERSPEEEYPPPLPDHDGQCHHHLEPHACYPFITPESTFVVKLTKSSRGLGLSVTGGIDSGGSWPGLIRIKRLFPHQPASACGLLNVGDLLVEVNGVTLTGLTNYEALEVLRTSPNQVDLKICRPPPDVLSCVSPVSEAPPPPPRREPPTSLHLPPGTYITPEDECYQGEFEVVLTKIQGSLGFTLRKEDDSALGHYVRALVREPALTDGRIRAGDKIIAVNEVEISQMTHEQAVQFLRQSGEIVKLRLYRDSAQTPVAALSPTETTPRTSFSKKTHLRQEAVDMLNDIAVRKLIPGNNSSHKSASSPATSPRRLRRNPCPSDASQSNDPSLKYQISEEQFHEGLLQKYPPQFEDENFSLFTIESDEDDEDKPPRPSSLDLYNPNQTPVAARKPRFNFSLAHNAYELNNLDADVLDAPNLTYNLGNDDVKSTEVECGDSFPQEPASMPYIPSDTTMEFSYKNPAYQSAHPQCSSSSDVDEKASNRSSNDDGSMKKWKGVQLKRETVHPVMEDEYEVLAIELTRGWNSRLGFSLQGAAGVTYVSAVHADSVAARDGRLKPGDRLIKVNDESVENMTTNEIIDLLRIVRGPVCIVVSRIKSKDCPRSNAEN